MCAVHTVLASVMNNFPSFAVFEATAGRGDSATALWAAGAIVPGASTIMAPTTSGVEPLAALVDAATATFAVSAAAAAIAAVVDAVAEPNSEPALAPTVRLLPAGNAPAAPNAKVPA